MAAPVASSSSTLSSSSFTTQPTTTTTSSAFTTTTPLSSLSSSTTQSSTTPLTTSSTLSSTTSSTTIVSTTPSSTSSSTSTTPISTFTTSTITSTSTTSTTTPTAISTSTASPIATPVLAQPITSADASKTNGNSSPAKVAGITAGSMIGVAVLLAIALVFWQRCRGSRRRNRDSDAQLSVKEYLMPQHNSPESGITKHAPQIPPMTTENKWPVSILPTYDEYESIAITRPSSPIQSDGDADLSRAGLLHEDILEESADIVQSPRFRSYSGRSSLMAAPQYAPAKPSEYIVSPIEKSTTPPPLHRHPAVRVSPNNDFQFPFQTHTTSANPQELPTNPYELPTTTTPPHHKTPAPSPKPRKNSPVPAARNPSPPPPTQFAAKDYVEIISPLNLNLDMPAPLFSRAPTPPPKSPLRSDRSRSRIRHSSYPESYVRQNITSDTGEGATPLGAGENAGEGTPLRDDGDFCVIKPAPQRPVSDGWVVGRKRKCDSTGSESELDFERVVEQEGFAKGEVSGLLKYGRPLVEGGKQVVAERNGADDVPILRTPSAGRPRPLRYEP